MKCQRCRKETFATIMSKFNSEEICMGCKDAEFQSPLYRKADDAEVQAVLSGNQNFPAPAYRLNSKNNRKFFILLV